MIERLRFEFLKLRSFIILLLLLVIFLLSYFFVNSEIEEYTNSAKNLEIDSDIEIIMKSFFNSYDIYGIYGHRIFLKPSPLMIFFYNSDIIEEIEGTIGTIEIIKIYFNVKGDKVLENPKVGFLDFGGILNIFGSLLMLILGVMTFKNRVFLFKGEKECFSRASFASCYWMPIFFF
jgi:hypothetical protein